MAKTHRNITKSYSYLASTIMNVSIKFEIDTARKIGARIWLECRRAWPKVNQFWAKPCWKYPPSLRSIPWALCPEIRENHKKRDEQIDRPTNIWTNGRISPFLLLVTSIPSSPTLLWESNNITDLSHYPVYESAVYGSIYMYITVTMTYMTSSISVITSSVCYPITIKLLLKEMFCLSVEQIL